MPGSTHNQQICPDQHIINRYAWINIYFLINRYARINIYFLINRYACINTYFLINRYAWINIYFLNQQICLHQHIFLSQQICPDQHIFLGQIQCRTNLSHTYQVYQVQPSRTLVCSHRPHLLLKLPASKIAKLKSCLMTVKLNYYCIKLVFKCTIILS